ncbi:hypothetical protein JCM2811A_00760 [Methylorubrum rhodinum]
MHQAPRTRHGTSVSAVDAGPPFECPSRDSRSTAASPPPRRPGGSGVGDTKQDILTIRRPS